MTSVFDSNGKNVACTLVEVGPCMVTQIRTEDKDGYSAVQLGYGERKEKHTTKAMAGHFKTSGVSPMRKLVEFDGFEDVALGDTITASIFEEGEYVDVVGTSKGKGFQGVVKRHGFHGVGDATHGQHNRLRAPGSIGAASYPARVFKGMRMAGQTGNKRVTVANLQVVKVKADENLVLLKGAVPGANGSYVIVQK